MPRHRTEFSAVWAYNPAIDRKPLFPYAPGDADSHSPARMSTPVSILQAWDPLRLGLAVIAALDVLLMPAPGTEVSYEGWGVLITMVVPALAPILIPVYLLDMTMVSILMKDRVPAQRSGYRWIFWIDVGFVVFLLAVLVPLVIALRRPG
jgi:hypothetical protein